MRLLLKDTSIGLYRLELTMKTLLGKSQIKQHVGIARSQRSSIRQ